MLFQSDKNSGCYDNLNFPLTYNGKMKIGIYCYLIAVILQHYTEIFIK